jgi:hypothetical protein
MHISKLLRATLGADSSVSDRWFVTNGSGAVGPVPLDLVARGIEAGKVSIEACYVRHETWKVWRALAEVGVSNATMADDESGVFEREVRDEALAAFNVPAAPAVDPLDGAADLHDAVLRLLAKAVERAGAEVALLHRLEGEGAVAVSAHGPKMFDAIGARTSLVDPAVMAAAAGLTVVAEPTPGPAGAASLHRLQKLGVAALASVMVPVRPHGQLVAMLELGRRSPFRLADVAAVEAIVASVVEAIEAQGWARRAA